MHFVVFVITKVRPTEKLLQETLAPFGRGGEERWDAWALGGRYSGNLKPLSFDDTITGGDDIPLAELAMASMLPPGINMVRPGVRGTGVDAAQIKNLAPDSLTGVGPLAILIDGRWHQCPIYPIEGTVERLGLRKRLEDEWLQKELRKERRAMKKWTDKAFELLRDVPRGDWLSVVDCHV